MDRNKDDREKGEEEKRRKEGKKERSHADGRTGHRLPRQHCGGCMQNEVGHKGRQKRRREEKREERRKEREVRIVSSRNGIIMLYI